MPRHRPSPPTFKMIVMHTGLITIIKANELPACKEL